MKIPSPTVNIDTSVNMAFTADKLNATKSYIDITDCWHAHCKRAKTFQFSLNHCDGVDTALHKCGLERARILELLKPWKGSKVRKLGRNGK